MRAGGCHCGSVRYETDGTPFHETICHCVDCRRVCGAASVAWFTVPRVSLRWTVDDPASYTSSPGVTRHFCALCGTALTFQDSKHPDEIDVTAASLDDPDQISPKDHVYVSQRPSWDVIGDELPQYSRGRSEG